MSGKRHIVPNVQNMPKDISKSCSKCPIIQRDVGIIKAAAAKIEEIADKMYLILNGNLEKRGLLSRMQGMEEKLDLLTKK
jgi:predicted nucleotide-binding protein (sugar kinase/HSP70/actin superfamily)